MKNIIKLSTLILIFFALTSCETKTFEDISDNTPITETVTYEKNVKAIIQDNCVVCHSPMGSTYPDLTDYTAVKSTVDNILDRIQRNNGDPLIMPQGGFLPQDKINVILKWKADGLLEK